MSKPIKLHTPLLNIVKMALHEIFTKGSYADKEVQKIIQQHKQFGSRDRSFIAETIYDIVRWKKNFEQIILEHQHPIDNWNYFIFLSLCYRKKEILNPELLAITIDWQSVSEHLKNLDDRASFPEWLDKRCFDEIGADWNKIAEALNIPARTFIRANELKIKTSTLLQLLKKEKVDAEMVSIESLNKMGYPISSGIEILSKNNLKNSDLYKSGYFEFQDIGSQLIGLFSNPKQHQQIVDLCAGGGGKSLQLSALLQNTGKVVACDFNAMRTQQLVYRAKQAGCTNIEIIPFEQASTLQNIDILLIDAPCSGLGTIKRNPDLKWKLQPSSIEKCMTIQTSLLSQYASILNKNGKMIYATCSILPSENEKQVQHFLHNNPEFELTNEIKLLPHLYGVDGFYMAELRKKNK